MNMNIGFIGCGNMATAMISGIIHSGYAPFENVYASNRSYQKLIDVKEKFNINITESNVEVAKNCHIIFLSVTPNMYPIVINEIKDEIQEDTIIILIAAGQTIKENETRFHKATKMIKAMPNSPVLVEEGMTAISCNQFITETDKQELHELFESFGKVAFIDENYMDIASAICGSSPAFAYIFMESLADSAVLYGLPRNLAYTFAAQALLGSAKMLLTTGNHPGKLKDDVCSPGGTTIESVAILEDSGFRSAIINAVKANMEKMSK